MDKELGLKKHDFNDRPIFTLQESISTSLDDIPSRGFEVFLFTFPSFRGIS